MRFSVAAGAGSRTRRKTGRFDADRSARALAGLDVEFPAVAGTNQAPSVDESVGKEATVVRARVGDDEPPAVLEAHDRHPLAVATGGGDMSRADLARRGRHRGPHRRVRVLPDQISDQRAKRSDHARTLRARSDIYSGSKTGYSRFLVLGSLNLGFSPQGHPLKSELGNRERRTENWLRGFGPVLVRSDSLTASARAAGAGGRPAPDAASPRRSGLPAAARTDRGGRAPRSWWRCRGCPRSPAREGWSPSA